jgi:trimethylamine--corrinoid protein Co-methyltransferase
MRPKIQLLSPELVDRILGEAFELLMNPGVRVGSAVVELLQAAGVEIRVENNNRVARLPEALVRKCLASVPRDFYLYNRHGGKAVHYGGDDVHFDPGSCCVQMLDPDTMEARSSETRDLVRIVQVTEMLPQFAAQSTAVVCTDAPSAIGDLYRLLVVLEHSDKPVVTGSFSSAGLEGMIDLLAADCGGRDQLREQPRAVFDVCPSPSLNWSEFGSHNLLDLARAGVPAELVSMPLAGGTAPVTLAGSVTQHAAESLAGITLHQLAGPGSPIVWGGAPAIFDMRSGGAPMGAIETVMLNMACCEVGKHLGLPTHGYLVATDSKFVDAQAGAESARSAMLGALSGINMISGAGMIESLACFSVEKLVMDAESIASAQRLVRGIEVRGETIATGMFAQTGLTGNFLKLKETRALFRQEQHIPSSVTDRSARGTEAPSDVFTRARTRVDELVSKWQKPSLPEEVRRKFHAIVDRAADRASVAAELPGN